MIALASVGRERAAAGTLLQMQMTVEAVRHTFAAKVVPLPFFQSAAQDGDTAGLAGI
jgi:hypothetical protein